MDGFFADLGLCYGQDVSSEGFFSMDDKLIWLATWQYSLLGIILWRSSFLGNLKASDNRVGLQGNPT